MFGSLHAGFMGITGTSTLIWDIVVYLWIPVPLIPANYLCMFDCPLYIWDDPNFYFLTYMSWTPVYPNYRFSDGNFSEALYVGLSQHTHWYKYYERVDFVLQWITLKLIMQFWFVQDSGSMEEIQYRAVKFYGTSVIYYGWQEQITDYGNKVQITD